MIAEFKKSLSGVKKLEKIVYPLLECPRGEEYLSSPDPEKIQDLQITAS
jgi:hypothetical protein